MKVEKIDCVAFYVKDLEKATKFLEDLLGIKFCKPFDLKEGGVRNVMDPMGLELISAARPSSGAAKAIEKRGEGFAMIGFKVPNLEEAIKEMESKGVRLVGKLQQGQVKFAQFHPKDTHGMMIELLEYDAPYAGLAVMDLE